MTLKSKDIKLLVSELIRSAKSEYLTFLSQVPVQKKSLNGTLKNWSPKDQVAHLVFWNKVFVFNVQAKKQNHDLLDSRHYLVMNDVGWFESKDKSWKEIERSIFEVFKSIDLEIKKSSVEELTNSKKFTIGTDIKNPEPLVRSLIYEIIDHPLHHFMGMYKDFNDKENALAMLDRMELELDNSELSEWTLPSVRKIKKYKKEMFV